MFNVNDETTLVSQLLNSIDKYLQIVGLSMKQNKFSSTDYSVDGTDQQNEEDDNNDGDDLWLSGHRSIFSSYGSVCQKNQSSIHSSQYESFHWDFYENNNYHHITFDNNQQFAYEEKQLCHWSMNFNTDDKVSVSCNRPRTSWNEIKTKSIQYSDSSSRDTSDSDNLTLSPLKLYHTFQYKKSQHHPCRLYENFSDKSLCDSLSTSSESSPSSSLHLNFVKEEDKISISKLISNKEQFKTTVDQCIQTSINLNHKDNCIIPHSHNTKHLFPNHTRASSISRHSLPNLDFLTYYAKENLASLPSIRNQTKHICKAMKSVSSEPLSLEKKVTYTVFYFTIEIPNQSTTPHPSLSTKAQVQRMEKIKRIKNIKSNPNKICHEETVTLSSTCSSTSSSGYFSNCSTNQPHHIQTHLSTHPLKSCLKRAKTEQSKASTPIVNNHSVDITRDTLILPDPFISNENDSIKDRRHSEPNTLANEQNLLLKFRTIDKNCTLSEHDLRTKKNVSFCDEIVRRLITPSTSLKHAHGGNS